MKYLVALLFLFICTSSIYSQEDNNRSHLELLDTMESKMADYASSGQKIMRLELGNLKKDSVVSVFRPLRDTRTYRFNAFPDSDSFKKIGLRVLLQDEDGEWKMQIQDIAFQGESQLDFKPSIFALYNIQVLAQGFVSDHSSGAFGLIITEISEIE